MGIAFGQVARLNAVAQLLNPNADPTLPPGPCMVTLAFLGRNGTPVGSQPGPIQINPGQATFLDLPASLLVNTLGQRADVRPTVMVESVPGMNACPGASSLAETFDVVTKQTWAAMSPGPHDNTLDADPDAGQTDLDAQARRFTRVADILTRAIARYDQISADLAGAGPSNDSAVQTALRAIDNNAQSIINRVLANPGPVNDPAVQRTIQGIADIGNQLSRDANTKLTGGITGPP